MNIEDYAQLIGVNLIRHSPVLILGVFGLWRTFVRKQQLAQVYVSAAWGFALVAAHALLSVFRDVAGAAARLNAVDAGSTPGEIGITLTLISLPAYLALLAALVFLGRAVLFGRGSDSPKITVGRSPPRKSGRH